MLNIPDRERLRILMNITVKGKSHEHFYCTSQNISKTGILLETNRILIKVDHLAKLIAEGPRKGKFTIVDARPGKRFNQGHIPGSISICDAQFDKNVPKLPKDKDMLLIFYCGGPS